MAEYTTIECDCGYSYSTNGFISICKNCEKKHYSYDKINNTIIVILIVLLCVILIVGSPVWVYLAARFNKSFWHYIGALALAGIGIYLSIDLMNNSDDFLIKTGYTGLVINSIGLLGATYFLYKIFKETRNKV